MIDHQLPISVLNIEQFDSQSCENIFRSPRAMSGVSSNVVNFTVSDFLRRADKVKAVQFIKAHYELSKSEASIPFPGHHKHVADWSKTTSL